MRRSRCAVLVGACGLAVSLVFVGCNAAKTSATLDEPASTGLARFQNAKPIPTPESHAERAAGGHDLASMARQSALDIESLRSQRSDVPAPPSGPSNDDAAQLATSDDAPRVGLRRAASTPRPASAAEPAPMPVARGAATERPVDTSAADREWAAFAGVTQASSTATQSHPEPARRPDTLTIAPTVAAWLRAGNLVEHNPAAAGMLLASLESATPGALADLGNDASSLRRSLSVDDLHALLSARDRLFAAAPAALSPDAPSAQGTTPDLPLKLGTTAFCSRVESFGKYQAIAQDTFPSGVPLRVLVYTEVEKFGDRETSDGQRAVELAQSLTLIQDATGSEVWSVPAQTILETTRRPRRDFYLVQQIEMPQNLALGSYKLRISVTDQTTKAMDEAWIKFTITADARSALARP